MEEDRVGVERAVIVRWPLATQGFLCCAPLQKVILAGSGGQFPSSHRRVGRALGLSLEICDSLLTAQPRGGARVCQPGRLGELGQLWCLLGKDLPGALCWKEPPMPLWETPLLLCKEAQQTHWLPRVNFGGVLPWFVFGTLGAEGVETHLHVKGF